MARIKLPSDFTLERYGLQVRLVNEDDAEFIVKLRTDPKLSRFIHTTDSNVDKQKEWIREYKVRESNGKEYYFIFSKDNSAVGLARLYSIHDNVFTSGSWIMAPNSPLDAVVASQMINREIAFETLGLTFEDNYDACHVDNKKVIKFNQMMGAKIYKHFKDENGEYVAMSLTKEDFESHKPKVLRMIGYK